MELIKQKYGIYDAYKNIKKSNGYIGSWCVDTHLSWLVYLSSVQASLTSDNYPTHYGCKCILLPIIFKWLQPKAKYNGGFLIICVFANCSICQRHMHQKLVQWIYALRRFKEISQRLGSFEQFGELSMVRRAFKNYLVYNSCNSRYDRFKNQL